MDWVEGTDLARLLRTQGRPGLSPSSVMRWLSDAASALTHLHTLERPVIHGDVKPANLILTRGGRVVLVDFGLSSSPDSPLRRGGTRGYAAPELMAGERPSRASDIYSLAATGFALLTGSAPQRDPSLMGRARPGGGRAARGGTAAGSCHRPGTTAADARGVPRAAPRRLGADTSDRRPHVLHDGHRGIDVDVGCPARGDGPSPRPARRANRRHRRSGRRPVHQSRWARATRPCRYSPTRRTRSPPCST